MGVVHRLILGHNTPLLTLRHRSIATRFESVRRQEYAPCLGSPTIERIMTIENYYRPLSSSLALLIRVAVLLFAFTGAHAIAQCPAVGNSAAQPIGPVAPSFFQLAGFGQSVAIGEGWCAVSSPRECPDPLGTATPHIGAVYVYRWAGSEWSLHQKICGPTNGSFFFGRSLTFLKGRLFVGASAEQTIGFGYGAVHEYSLDATGHWSLKSSIFPRPFDRAAAFGYLVESSDDQLIVAAPGLLAPSGLEGKVFIFEEVGSQWTLVQELAPSQNLTPSPASMSFGENLAASSERLLVGLGDIDNCVVAYRKTGGQWIETDVLCGGVTGPFSGSDFARTVVVDDISAFIGQTRYEPIPGRVHIFDFDGADRLTFRQTITATQFGGVPYDEFGASIATANGQLLVGCASYGGGSPSVSPTSLVFTRGPTGDFSIQHELSIPSQPMGNRFGAAVALGEGVALVGDTIATVDPVGPTGMAFSFRLPLGEVYCQPPVGSFAPTLTLTGSPELSSGGLTAELRCGAAGALGAIYAARANDAFFGGGLPSISGLCIGRKLVRISNGVFQLDSTGAASVLCSAPGAFTDGLSQRIVCQGVFRAGSTTLFSNAVAVDVR